METGPPRDVDGADRRPRGERGRATERRSLQLDDPAAYGLAFADVYNRWYHGDGAADGGLQALCDFVAERTPSGIVIELGVGTGRLADPLIEQGLTVIGVDASLAMLSRCNPRVVRVAADMATLPFDTGSIERQREYGPTVLCGFNTVFNLHSRSRLRQLVGAVARMRATFIVEMLNTDLLADSPERSTGRSPLPATRDGVIVSSTTVDHQQQLMVGRHLEISNGGVISRPWMLRWITMTELDDEAAAAGLNPAERFGDWYRQPFTSRSDSVISVYRPSQNS